MVVGKLVRVVVYTPKKARRLILGDTARHLESWAKAGEYVPIACKLQSQFRHSMSREQKNIQ